MTVSLQARLSTLPQLFHEQRRFWIYHSIYTSSTHCVTNGSEQCIGYVHPAITVIANVLFKHLCFLFWTFHEQESECDHSIFLFWCVNMGIAASFWILHSDGVLAYLGVLLSLGNGWHGTAHY